MICYNCGERTPNEESIFCYSCNKRYLKSKGRIALGMSIFILSSIIAIGSYISAYNSPDGGTYIVLYGFIIFGFTDFLKGISDYMHFKKIVKDPSKYERKDVDDGNINEEALERYLSYKNDKELVF